MSRTKGLPNIWVGLAGGVLAGAMVLPQAATAQDVNYADDVAVIVRDNCVRCHREGTAAPMVLETYEQVKAWAPLIKKAVETRTMPPGWYIDRTVGIQDFKNDPSLSEREIETIVGWVDSGTPAGNLAQLPPTREWRADHEYWQIEQDFDMGPPDMIITSPPFTVPANSGDQWWEPDVDVNDVLDKPVTERRWVKAVETRPADTESGYVFHHANTFLRRADVDDVDAGGRLSGSAVGKRMDMYPEDAGKLILPDDKLHFSMHLFPIGREVVDAQIQVGVWLYPEGERPQYATPDEISHNSGESSSLGLPRYTDMLIPPHGYQLIRGTFVLEENARVHSIRGHMHLRGGYQMMEAIYPDGRREVINKIDWNHLWHTTHIYEDWVQPLLPKGTVIIATALMDNTADNPSNPDPDQWVVYGRRSASEMAHTRFGMTYIPDEDFADMVAERERILRQRDNRPAADGGG
jgi:mono/diheme cytochrome c family protein